MGILAAFNPEDRVEVKFSDFYTLMQAAAEAQANLHYIENAVKANVPNAYIQSMMDGKPYAPQPYYGKEESEETDDNVS